MRVDMYFYLCEKFLFDAAPNVKNIFFFFSLFYVGFRSRVLYSIQLGNYKAFGRLKSLKDLLKTFFRVSFF